MNHYESDAVTRFHGDARVDGESGDVGNARRTEQIGNGNVVPTTSKMLFRESGDTNTFDLGKGFLASVVHDDALHSVPRAHSKRDRKLRLRQVARPALD